MIRQRITTKGAELSRSRRRLVRLRGQERFTLIEMLIVIAIIGVIAAMLLPATQKAMESARQAFCANNQGKSLTALQQYSNDYHSYFLAYGVLDAPGYPANRDVIHWYKPLIGATIGGYSASFSTYVDSRNVFICPSQAHSSYSPTASYIDDNCYGIFTDWGGTTPPGTPARFPLHSLRQIVNQNGNTTRGVDSYSFARARYPSRSLLLSDTLRSVYYIQLNKFYKTINYTHSSSGGLHLRHNELANAGFMDGHVSALSVGGWDDVGEFLFGSMSTFAWSNNRFDLYIGSQYQPLPAQ